MIDTSVYFDVVALGHCRASFNTSAVLVGAWPMLSSSCLLVLFVVQACLESPHEKDAHGTS